MKSCWDLEFEPSIKVIVDYIFMLHRYDGGSLNSLSLASSHSGEIFLFSLAPGLVEVTSESTGSSRMLQ